MWCDVGAGGASKFHFALPHQYVLMHQVVAGVELDFQHGVAHARLLRVSFSEQVTGFVVVIQSLCALVRRAVKHDLRASGCGQVVSCLAALVSSCVSYVRPFHVIVDSVGAGFQIHIERAFLSLIRIFV